MFDVCVLSVRRYIRALTYLNVGKLHAHVGDEGAYLEKPKTCPCTAHTSNQSNKNKQWEFSFLPVRVYIRAFTYLTVGKLHAHAGDKGHFLENDTVSLLELMDGDDEAAAQLALVTCQLQTSGRFDQEYPEIGLGWGISVLVSAHHLQAHLFTMF